VNAFAIARASPRVSAMLVASEDMVADLGTARSRRGEELAYVRARFLVECRAAGVEAIDCPYTFSDVKGRGRGRQNRGAPLSHEEPGRSLARESDQRGLLAEQGESQEAA
jgi:citrate lyase subunit beta/citryl-CoA lyase